MGLIRKNFIYNNLIGFTNVLVPIILFPYISGILGPSGIGIVSFTVSLTAIFILIGSLGIPIYGIREVAKVKNNKDELSKVFSELFVIQLVWMLITLIIYASWLFFTNTFENEEVIKYASFFHVFSFIGVLNWFFQGIENYRYITVINFVMKLLMLILLFVLIKQENDYWLYYVIIVATTSIGAIISLLYAFKFVNIRFRKLKFKKHLKAILILFSTQLAIGIYINLDIIFLNYFSNEYQVGIYTPASKLVKLALLIVTSLGTVLIPKISLYIKEGKTAETKILITKSLQFILMISFPIIFVLLCLSEEVIYLFAGDKFTYSSVLLVMLTPIIFLIGLSNIFGLQILVPTNKENKLMISVMIGAIISLILNYLLIPEYKAKGAVYSILVTELIITILTYYYARKEIDFKIPIKKGLSYFLLSLFIIPICYMMHLLFEGITYLFTTLTLSIIVYIFGLLIIKDSFFKENVWSPIFKSVK